jgi:hypothetical protein
MYKKIAIIMIITLGLMAGRGSMFVLPAYAQSPGGSYSITSINTFSTAFRITLEGVNNAGYFNVFKKSNDTLVNAVPVDIGSALNSMPAVYADITDLEVRVYSDPAGKSAVAEFSLNSSGQLIMKQLFPADSGEDTSSSGSKSSGSSGSSSSGKTSSKGSTGAATGSTGTVIETVPNATTENALTVSSQPMTPPDQISVVLNGKPVVFDQPPVIVDNRTIAPIRAIFEAMGAQVFWNETERTVTVKNEMTTILVKIDNTQAYVNGAEKILDVPAQIINSRTLVPVRFISESLGATVGWSDTTRTVTITQ